MRRRPSGTHTGTAAERACGRICKSQGYRSCRATHAVTDGAWYYEVKMEHLGDTGHARVGWCASRQEASRVPNMTSHTSRVRVAVVGRQGDRQGRHRGPDWRRRKRLRLRKSRHPRPRRTGCSVWTGGALTRARGSSRPRGTRRGAKRVAAGVVTTHKHHLVDVLRPYAPRERSGDP